MHVGTAPDRAELLGLDPLPKPSVQAVAPVAPCDQGDRRAMRSKRLAYAAVVRNRTVAYVRPGGRHLKTFGRMNVNGFPTVFGVLGEVLDENCEPTWFRVQLPVRPNGSTGYVRASTVQVLPVHSRIEVDLSARRIAFYENGKRLLTVVAAVGAPLTPTPTGSYYVNQRLRASDPFGPFGPAALGISAFSPVLQDWIQGGPIAIHGTNDPSSIGRAVSHGCLRVDNDTLRWLWSRTPAGTPVEIKA
jgi:hypothetical protein